MAKRMQEQKDEERIVAKSKPTVMNLSSTVSASSSSAKDPIASKSPGILRVSAKPDARARRNLKPRRSVGKPAATDKSQESWGFSESESWSDHEKEVTGKLVVRPELLALQRIPWLEAEKWPHNFPKSPAVVPHMGKVYSIVRKIYGRSPTDNLNDLDVITAPWGIFMNVTLQAAVHLGPVFIENLLFTKNQLLKSVTQLFQVTEKLIEDQTAISGLNTIDYEQPTWRLTTLMCDNAMEILGSISDQPVEAWKNQIKWYLENRFLKDLNRIDGEPMVFEEWKIFPGFTTLGILEEIDKFLTEQQCEPEQFKDRIIFMSMDNDIVCRERWNTEKCEKNSVTVANYARRFPLGRWSFLGPGSEKKWYGTFSDEQDGDWDKTVERVMLNFAESSHPTFRATSALEMWELWSKEKGKKSIHFNGCEENIELTLPAQYLRSSSRFVQRIIQRFRSCRETWCKRIFWKQWKFLQKLPIAYPPTDAKLQGNLLQDYERKFEQLPEDPKLSKLCCDA